MAPPPPLPSMPASTGPQSNHSSQSSTLPQPAPAQQTDLFAELLRLGLNPEDLAKQSSIRPQVREEVVKNLQAILGKKDSADLLRKLMPLRNEWPTTSTNANTSSTPTDYQRNNNGPVGTGSGSSKDNILASSILSGAGGNTGGTMSFTDHINNGNSSQQQEQDAQYASAQQQHLRQAVASSVNHHQHFRLPTTSSAMHNSPLQQQQQQQMLSQHKSVLSLHHQYHLTHPHQADPAHRQRLNQQHKLNPLPNSSITNLNDIKGSSSSSTSSSNQALLDAKSVNIFNHRSSPAISPYTLPAAGSTPRVPSIMDAINGQPSLDTMHDNSPLHQHINQITMNNRDKLKSMARQQQLQKQFRINAEKHKNLPWPNQAGSTSNLNLASEPQITQRIIGSSNNTGSINHAGLSQLQRQLTSPISTAISPPQTTPGLPKSLLNLAACSSSPPYTNNANQMSSNSRNQMSNIRSANANQFGNLTIPANNRAVVRNDIDTASNQKAAPIADPTSLLHQMMRGSSGSKNFSVNSNNRSNYSNFSLSSLLSDDQSRNSNNSNNSRPNTYQAPASLSNYQAGPPTQRRPSSTKSDESSLLQNNNSSKDPYAVYLREKTAKAGISTGKIAQARDNVDHPSRLQNVLMAEPQAIEPPDESQEDIDSALSRVEARNDLSLLYPPVSLASNSQRQINSLSAGLQLPGELDHFTDEIKKIIQEDCNIIYECKTCSNLFRSLANLVKHKRLYCKEDKYKTIQLELNRRSNMNAMSTLDMSVTKSSRDNTFSRQIPSREGGDSETSLPVDGKAKLQEDQSASNGLQKYNLRGKRVDVSFLVANSRSSRSTKNQDRFKDSGSQQSPTTRNYAENLENNSGQTYLSRLLQSQPRNRLSPMKDSALMDALSVAPSLPTGRSMIGNSSLSKFNEQLVRNSSLAKTLLSENVKSISVNQSSSTLTNIDNSSVPNQKSSAPKRKLLEDCISKVKRDKMGPSENTSCDSTLVESQLSPMAASQDESEPYRDPLEINDSGADSDALVMDIDCGNTAGDNEHEPDTKAEEDIEGTNDKNSNDGEDKDVDGEENITEEQSTVDDAEANTNDISSDDIVDDEAQDDVVKTEATSGVSNHADCNDEIKIDDDEHGNQSNSGEQEDEEDVQEEEDDDDEEGEDDEDDGDDGDDGDEGDDEDNEEDNEDDDDDEDGDCDDSDAGETSAAFMSSIKSERKSSYCSSTRSESDPNSLDIRDKNSKHKYYDNASSHTSSRSSSKSSTVNTMDGSGGCKLILKTALAGSSRDGSGGSGSGASTSSGGPGSSGGGGGGGGSSGGSIMKVKIQLKTQPDEKSKVYRIVE